MFPLQTYALIASRLNYNVDAYYSVYLKGWRKSMTTPPSSYTFTASVPPTYSLQYPLIRYGFLSLQFYISTVAFNRLTIMIHKNNF